MMYSASAKKRKYHLCIRAGGRGKVAEFVLMNTGEIGAARSKCVVLPCRLVPVPPCTSNLSEIALGLPFHFGNYEMAKASTFNAIGMTAARMIAERWRQPDMKAAYEPGVWREVLENLERVTGPDPSNAELRRLRMLALARRSRPIAKRNVARPPARA